MGFPLPNGRFDSLAIKPLKGLGAKVYVFGSRARGDQQLLHIVGQIKDNLEVRNLKIKVDLVDMADLAESYRENINMSRVQV